MSRVVEYALDIGGVTGILLLVLCGLAVGVWYVLVRLFGKNDGIVTNNATAIKDRAVDFLIGLDRSLVAISGFHDKQERSFKSHCSLNHADHISTHQALYVVLDSILTMIQSQEILTNGEKRRVEQMLIEAKTRLEKDQP
jgi:hypothetical protein